MSKFQCVRGTGRPAKSAPKSSILGQRDKACAGASGADLPTYCALSDRFAGLLQPHFPLALSTTDRCSNCATEDHPSETSPLFSGGISPPNADCARPGGCRAAPFLRPATRLPRGDGRVRRFCRLGRSDRLRQSNNLCVGRANSAECLDSGRAVAGSSQAKPGHKDTPWCAGLSPATLVLRGGGAESRDLALRRLGPRLRGAQSQ